MSRYIDADLIGYEPMCRAKSNGMYEGCEIAYKDQIDDIPTAQPEYYDYSDIDDVWEFYAEEQDINLTDGAKQLKDAMWVGYQKGKQDAQPTADVRENAKGEWLDMECIEESEANVITEWQQARCSVCGKWHTTPYQYGFFYYSYCPNCGAEMRCGI